MRWWNLVGHNSSNLFLFMTKDFVTKVPPALTGAGRLALRWERMIKGMLEKVIRKDFTHLHSAIYKTMIYIYICMYVCIYTHVYTHVYNCIYIYMYTYIMCVCVRVLCLCLDILELLGSDRCGTSVEWCWIPTEALICPLCNNQAGCSKPPHLANLTGLSRSQIWEWPDKAAISKGVFWFLFRTCHAVMLGSTGPYLLGNSASAIWKMFRFING